MRFTNEDGEIINTPFLYTPYNYNALSHTEETAIECDPAEDMTQQQFRDETDINTIVANYGVTGLVPQTTKQPLEGDYTEAVTDYHTAAELIRQADQNFMELPSDVRKKFHNNPQELLEFVADEKNYDEAVKLGIAVERPKPELKIELPLKTEPKTEPKKE